MTSSRTHDYGSNPVPLVQRTHVEDHNGGHERADVLNMPTGAFGTVSTELESQKIEVLHCNWQFSKLPSGLRPFKNSPASHATLWSKSFEQGLVGYNSID